MRFRISAAFVFGACAFAMPLVAQESFDSADAAAQAIVAAAGDHDIARLTAILGPNEKSLLTSGNAAQDTAEQSEFARLFRERHQLHTDSRDAGRVILSIGDENWPFPVPIVRANGKWRFDPSGARVEMAARRIGAHELDAVEICAGYVEAQRKYASADRDKAGILRYAARLMSTPGHHDGLYWDGETDPLAPRAFADAGWDSANGKPKAYHGYYFRVLKAQGPDAPGGAHNYVVKNRLMGGFGLVAWPAQYGVTGIHTFIVNQDGVVYEKDIAPAPGGNSPVTSYNPDSTWSVVD